ncbi:MAG: tetratricopeptide repeat protein [Pseudomonadota bacterium]
MLDSRHTPTSTGNPDHLVAYDEALMAVLTMKGNPIESLKPTMMDSPDFMMGHLLPAAILAGASERRFNEMATYYLSKAKPLLDDAVDRELSLFNALQLLTNGEWDKAPIAFDRHLSEYPRDVLALHTSHIMDFHQGDALNLRNRVARVIPTWDADMPGYSYLYGMYAFGLEESNQYELAEQRGRHALELNPVDPWAVHAVTHVMEMQGRASEGVEFMRTYEAYWAKGCMFAVHVWWHMALLHLQNGEDNETLAILDQSIIDPGMEMVQDLMDATAMLWRLRLCGVETGDRDQTAVDLWLQKLESGIGFSGFNDFHAAMGFAATGQVDALRQLEIASLAAAEQGIASQQIALPLIQAFLAYAKEDYQTTTILLAENRGTAWRFGGSHAQRDVINLTLLDAANRAGERSVVQQLMNERLMAKENDALGQRLLANVG